MTAFLGQRDRNFLAADDCIRLLRAVLCAVKIDVAAKPHRQRAIVNISFLVRSHSAIAVKHMDPFLIRLVVLVRNRSNRRIIIGPLVVLCALFELLHAIADRPLHENVVVKTDISVQDRHEAGDFRAVRQVIRRVARRCEIPGSVVDAAADSRDGSREQVVDERGTLAGILHIEIRKHYVVVNERRAM